MFEVEPGFDDAQRLLPLENYDDYGPEDFLTINFFDETDGVTAFSNEVGIGEIFPVLQEGFDSGSLSHSVD